VVPFVYLFSGDLAMKSTGFTLTVSLGLLVGILFCLWRITRGVGTQTEALLLSVILTIASTLASWVVSNYYANYSYDENLRVFALKASEKVTNLSNELTRLSVFLQQELESEDYDSPREELLHRDARIEAAIHIINTLKSVNDKSLSDWQGVIGEEISAKLEVQEEREEHLRELLERVESLPAETLAEYGNQRHSDAAVGVRSELESIRKDIRMLATQVSGVPLRTTFAKAQRVKLQDPWPLSSSMVSYKQRPVENSIKSTACKHCGAKLFSQYLNGQFVLQVRAPRPETFTCPACKQQTSATVDPVPGAQQLSPCTHCGAELRICRASSGISVDITDTLQPSDELYDEEFLQRVKETMPPQPWATGAAKLAARTLGITPRRLSGAISELVRRGVFKLQMDGELYEPIPKG